MVATAQRYSELNPEVQIVWERRSLKDFEEFPIEQLAGTYDLLVIDHPFVGYAADHGVFAPLDDWLPAEFLAEQAASAVGASHASYQWAGKQWALAIDTATPVAAWRPDLMNAHGLQLPATLSDVITLARAGHLELPAAPINCLMTFYGLCIAAGEAPFQKAYCVVSTDTGMVALAWLQLLISLCAPEALARNPIQSLDLLASRNNQRTAYCLFPYGYSNYAQEGYADHPLSFGDLPSATVGQPHLTTTLGGTGLALSARSAHLTQAADYARYVAAPETQRTLYARSGGQPGHRSAWLDPENNRRTGGYFQSTLPALDRALLRPRYAGYLHGFQQLAGPVLHQGVQGKKDLKETLQELDLLYVASQLSTR